MKMSKYSTSAVNKKSVRQGKIYFIIGQLVNAQTNYLTKQWEKSKQTFLTRHMVMPEG